MLRKVLRNFFRGRAVDQKSDVFNYQVQSKMACFFMKHQKNHQNRLSCYLTSGNITLRGRSRKNKGKYLALSGNLQNKFSAYLE